MSLIYKLSKFQHIKIKEVHCKCHGFNFRLDLHPVSGIITVKTAGGPNWDREQVTRHYLTVEARDDLGNGNRNSVQLIINIQDVNDNPPVFTQTSYEARLLENKMDFENVLRIEARDADLNGTKNSDIEYSVFGEYKKNFSIDSMTGIIKPRYPMDFEKLPGGTNGNTRLVFLKVRARDWGTPSLFTDAPLTIYVQDVNDNPPLFEETFYNKSIPENVPGGTPILRVQAVDLDGSSPNNHIVYRIQSGASDKFIIGAETGEISVARGATLDPDLTIPRKTHYSLKVIALDGAPGENQLQSAVFVNITVLDVNNKNPLIEDPGILTIKENTPVGTVITDIVAMDPDATSDLRYKFDFCEAKSERGTPLKQSDFDCLSAFNIGETDGVITMAKLLDRETVEMLQIVVLVEDVGSDTGPQVAKGKTK